jgi:hypothetical protein
MASRIESTQALAARALVQCRRCTLSSNLGAEVGATLDQQIVVRDFRLRPLPGLGRKAAKSSMPLLTTVSSAYKPIELCGPIHYCSPTLKKTQHGVGPPNAATRCQRRSTPEVA